MRRFNIALMLTFISSVFCFGQNGYLEDTLYLNASVTNCEDWIRFIGLETDIIFDELIIADDSIVIKLEIPFTQDSARVKWKGIRKEVYQKYGIRFERKLIDRLSFILDMPHEDVSILIRSSDNDARFEIRYVDNKLVLNEFFDNEMGSGTIELTSINLKNFYRNTSDTLQAVSLIRIRREIGEFLVGYYKSKGTPILYNARIDTSRTYYNEITYDISHLSNEVIDDGYYEFIRINIKVSDRNGVVSIDYNIEGKYGSGILFVPRKSGYKDMGVSYSSDLKEYEQHLSRKLDEFLKNKLYDKQD